MKSLAFKKENGFTLIELLLTLTIVTILVSVGIPSFQHIYHLQKTQTTTNRLIKNINFSRSYAISKGRSITICPTADNLLCSKNWNQKLLIFVDYNANGKRENKQEKILRVVDAAPKNSQITWKAFQNKAFMQFTHFGTTQQNGSLVYCPSNKDTRYARQVVINKGGRPRLTKDQNNNGIAEDTNGRDIQC